jgi:hypothetical protein
MEVVLLILYFGFFICEALAAFKVPFARIEVGWLGLTLFALALLLGGVIPLAQGRLGRP